VLDFLIAKLEHVIPFNFKVPKFKQGKNVGKSPKDDQFLGCLMMIH
jgi:hypothetical protein